MPTKNPPANEAMPELADPGQLEHVTHPNLETALSAFQGEMPVVLKDETATVPTKAGGQYRYTYANLASITRAIAPLLARHGLAFSCTPEVLDGRPYLRGRLLHESGQGGPLDGTLPLSSAGPQEVGSSITYMRRYLLGALTGVVTDDDDEGAAAQTAYRSQRAEEESARPARPGRGGAAGLRAAADRARGASAPPPLTDQTRAAILEWGETANVELSPDFMSRVVGRTVAGWGDLTEADGQTVLVAIRQATDAPTPGFGA